MCYFTCISESSKSLGLLLRRDSAYLILTLCKMGIWLGTVTEFTYVWSILKYTVLTPPGPPFRVHWRAAGYQRDHSASIRYTRRQTCTQLLLSLTKCNSPWYPGRYSFNTLVCANLYSTTPICVHQYVFCKGMQCILTPFTSVVEYECYFPTY